MIRKTFRLVTVFIAFAFIFIPTVVAHCPLCTLAAGAGLGIARSYGVDDSIVGLFIGALIASSALWFNKWLKNKIEIPFQEFLAVLTSFLLVFVPLYIARIITNVDLIKLSPTSSLFGLGSFGIDRLLFGIIAGTIATWFAFWLSSYIMKKRKKAFWNYQGLSFMIIILTVLSLMLWLVTK